MESSPSESHTRECHASSFAAQLSAVVLCRPGRAIASLLSRLACLELAALHACMSSAPTAIKESKDADFELAVSIQIHEQGRSGVEWVV